jgi:parallel beta-helix repeat protein
MFSCKRSVRFLAPILCAAAASAATWCVNPTGASGCKTTIGAAVAAAAAGDTVSVAAGTYKESVKIGMPLALTGADAATTIIDATGLANGIYVDGIDNNALAGVFISGFTVQNANFEGILVANASATTISGNIVQNNDKSLAFSTVQSACPGLPAFETNEADDCGEGIHLLGADHSVVVDNTVENNAGGILLSDDTAAVHHNLIAGNLVSNNAYDCGITLASHVPAALTNSANPLGVYNNNVVSNQSLQNGLLGDGAGVGIFASAPGTASYSNAVVNNTVTGNGIPGVTLHGHAPNQNLNANLIIGNTLSGNGADTAPTSTPGPAGINIWAVSPISGIIVSQNIFSNEALDVVVNAPGDFRVQRNSFPRGTIGVMNAGGGNVNADSNYWGCSSDPRTQVPGFALCAMISGPVTVTTWVTSPISK